MANVVIPTKLRFAGYRRFESNRIKANNSMIALLVASRLGIHGLEAHAGSSVPLPQMYPAVNGIDLLNRTASDTQAILESAERHLTLMAVPFVQSVYEALVGDCIALLSGAGFRPSPAERRRGLMGLHDAIERASGAEFEPKHRELVDFLRVLRNQIIHEGSASGSKPDSSWNNLSSAAQKEWRALADRPYVLGGDSTGIDLDAPELVAALAVTKRLSRELCGHLLITLTKPDWVGIEVGDFETHHPNGLKRRSSLAREIASFARRNYGAVAATQREVAIELARREKA